MITTPQARPEPVVHTLNADDGVTLGYRRLGSGPGVVVLHGAMSTGLHHRELAEHLASDFTVYLPDRRGRGVSGPRRPGDGLDRDVSDLGLLLRTTGARDVVAVSSGAIVALNAVLLESGAEDGELYVRRLVVNEPPLIPADRAKSLVATLDAQLARGDLGAALVTGMKGGELGPAFLNRVPDRLLAAMVRLGMNRPLVKGADYPTMSELAPTLAADFGVVADQGRLGVERFAGLRLPVTCVRGEKSPAYLRDGVQRLAGLIPGAAVVDLPGVGHEVSWNSDLRGRPELLADVVRRALQG